MCDYSLEQARQRPAQKGEQLVLRKFRTGSVGAQAPGDAARPDYEPTAVCLACDTQVTVSGISDGAQRLYGLKETERAVLTHLPPSERSLYRDAFRFENGETVSLRDLCGAALLVEILSGIAEPVDFDAVSSAALEPA